MFKKLLYEYVSTLPKMQSKIEIGLSQSRMSSKSEAAQSRSVLTLSDLLHFTLSSKVS